MRRFALLYERLVAAANDLRRTELLVHYFKAASKADILWSIVLLGQFTDRYPKRLTTRAVLKIWAMESSLIPTWLFEESISITNDLMDTIALLSPGNEGRDAETLSGLMIRLITLGNETDYKKREFVVNAWSQMEYEEKYVFNRIITGGFKADVSRNVLVTALTAVVDLDEHELMFRLVNKWDPVTISYEDLLEVRSSELVCYKPNPFFNAIELLGPIEDRRPLDAYQFERYWEGLRSQLIVRNGEIYMWSDRGDYLNDKLPELRILVEHIKEDSVLDGVILAFREGRPAPLSILEHRLKLKNLSKKVLDVTPVVFMAYDLLEFNGADIQKLPLSKRRNKLEQIISTATHPSLLMADLLQAATWPELDSLRMKSRRHASQGILLRELDGLYSQPPSELLWWKWPSEVFKMTAVLTYAMSGEDKNGQFFTELTFGVKEREEWVTIAKSRSGISDQESNEIENFVKQNTLERFGPVRSVRPELIFELSFSDIHASARHKYGIHLSHVKILKWKRTSQLNAVNTLSELKELLKTYD